MFVSFGAVFRASEEFAELVHQGVAAAAPARGHLRLGARRLIGRLVLVGPEMNSCTGGNFYCQPPTKSAHFMTGMNCTNFVFLSLFQVRQRKKP